MKKLLLALALLSVQKIHAQAPAKNIRPDAYVTFEGEKSIKVLSATQAEVFLLFSNKAFTAILENETVNESNNRMSQLPGILSFSRGGDGTCKIVLEPAHVIETLVNVIGFTKTEAAQIFQ